MCRTAHTQSADDCGTTRGPPWISLNPDLERAALHSEHLNGTASSDLTRGVRLLRTGSVTLRLVGEEDDGATLRETEAEIIHMLNMTLAAEGGYAALQRERTVRQMMNVPSVAK
jgi:hypothetical protein